MSHPSVLIQWHEVGNFSRFFEQILEPILGAIQHPVEMQAVIRETIEELEEVLKVLKPA